MSQSELEKQQSLEAAFNFFNETSAQLENSYRALETKVQNLSKELDQSEQQLEREHKRHSLLEERMQALLHFLPGGVLVLDERGVIVEANPAAEKLLQSSLVDKVWRHIINDCFKPQNDDGLEVSTHSGRRLSVSTSSLMERGQIILLTDLTETRALQEHLSRNERLSAMGKMVSALAHQIRTPLSAAMLYAGHLCDAELEPSLQKRFAKKCLSRLSHMEKQVRDMMLFVKSELPLNDVITVGELDLQLKLAAEHLLQDSRLELNWQNHCAEASLKCHVDALVSALMNLVNNALQSMSAYASQKLTICFAEDSLKQQLNVTISDSGPGMDKQTLEQVQKMFVTTKTNGTGLGLAVVKAVCRAHAATFSLESEPGVGCRASIQLPLIEVSAA
ncbi:sensor histidine kinase [Agaribacterium haliotis]|uniref:sensor histidine kinase n=1 Tax=Agaribacterium haliotis TaxID=2013869 RepID=UPI001EFC64A6|nr:PAS domain-containing sensor histidine kinase [Agaribacterium haliotis]